MIAAVNDNMDKLNIIAADTQDLTIRNITRPLTVPQMVTWMLYAAAVNNDILKYKRYPLIDLRTYDYFTTPQKKKINSIATPESSSSTTSSSSSSSSSSSNSYK